MQKGEFTLAGRGGSANVRRGYEMMIHTYIYMQRNESTESGKERKSERDRNCVREVEELYSTER